MFKIKRKNRLSYEQRAEVLNKVKKGESRESIVNEFGISISTYHRIIKRETEVEKKRSDYEFKNEELPKTCDNRLLEEALFRWFEQARNKGDLISGTNIQEKALTFNKIFNGSSTFKASNGWLCKFKRRYGISETKIKEEKLSSDLGAVTEKFPKTFEHNNISSSEVLSSLYKVRVWMNSHSECLSQHFRIIEEVEDLIRQKLKENSENSELSQTL